MATETSQVFQLNGSNYDSSKLSPEGQQVLGLLTEAQNELSRLENRKALFQAAQQQLINQLKPLLPAPIASQPTDDAEVLGCASDQIPTTPAEKPQEKPAPFPNNIPEEIRAKGQ